jgi:hypothetical protein
VLSKQEETHRQIQQTVETFKGKLIPVPAESLQVSNKISAVLSPVSMVAKSGAEIHNIFLGVQSLQQNMKGPFIPPQYIIGMRADYDRRRNRGTTAMAITAGTPETTAGHPIEASEGNWRIVPANVRVSDLG